MRQFIVTASIAALLSMGCSGGSSDDAAGSGSEALFSTPACTMRGAGLLGADSFDGEIIGEQFGASGSWTHTSGDSTFTLNPAWILCRINGVFVADVGGTARINGQRGYSFRMFVQDNNYVSEDPPIVAEAPQDGETESGTTAIQTVTATRTYAPAGHTIGSVDTAGHAVVAIPTELPVIAGSAGHHWARVRFERSVYGDTLTCRYRGAGTSYQFVRCTGELDDTPAVGANDYVEVAWMTLSIQNGDQKAGATTVSVDFNVTTFNAQPPPAPEILDYYRISIFQDSARLFHREGMLTQGDIELVLPE